MTASSQVPEAIKDLLSEREALIATLCRAIGANLNRLGVTYEVVKRIADGESISPELHGAINAIRCRLRQLESENARYVALASELRDVEATVANAATEIGALRRALSRKREE